MKTDAAGAMNNNAKLTAADVAVIRMLSARGYNATQIALVMPVKACTVRDILTGRTWKGVTR